MLKFAIKASLGFLVMSNKTLDSNTSMMLQNRREDTTFLIALDDPRLSRQVRVLRLQGQLIGPL